MWSISKEEVDEEEEGGAAAAFPLEKWSGEEDEAIRSFLKGCKGDTAEISCLVQQPAALFLDEPWNKATVETTTLPTHMLRMVG